MLESISVTHLTNRLEEKGPTVQSTDTEKAFDKFNIYSR